MNEVRLRGRLPLRSNELGLLVAIIVVVLLTAWIDSNHTYWNDIASYWTAVRSDGVLSTALPESLVDIARNVALLGMFSLGACVVIIAGGIDLSAGSVIAFSGTVCGSILVVLAPEAMDPAKFSSGEALAPIGAGVIAAALLGTLVVGLLVGSLHAWLITGVGLPPFIATLATLVGLRSLARAICSTVTAGYLGGATTQISITDEGFRYLANSVWIPFAVFVALALGTWLLLSRTVVGRHLYALGGNEQAARLSGIQTDRVKWLAYCISALTASIAGFFYVSQVSTATPHTDGMGEELNAIAAAVVGGCSLKGGVGTVSGAVLGVLFLRCVIDGIAKIIKTGADVYQGLIVGIVVVVAVALSQLRQARGHGKRFFAGALGWVSIVTLAMLAGTLALVMAGGHNALWTTPISLIALLALKGWESRGDRQARNTRG